MIPKEVNVLPEIKTYSTLSIPMLDALRKGFICIVIARLLATLSSYIFYKKSKSEKENFSIFHYISKYTTPFLPEINPDVEYDLAIGFISPFHFLRDKVNAKKKIGWIHTDFSILEINRVDELPVWDSCNYLASVSESVAKAFLTSFPTLKDKILVIENIISPAFVHEQALLNDFNEDIPEENGLIKLCSVGRYSYPKNFDNVPYICHHLIKRGVNVKWYIIGYGGREEQIIKNIKESGMEGRVILLGKKINPYPYMLKCDIYVQPSRYEGKAVTVREAQILYKPVVITNFPTAESQVNDGFDGIIVPLDNEGAAEGMQRFIEDLELQKIIIGNLHKCDYGNELEVEKIYDLIKPMKSKMDDIVKDC